MSKETRKMLDVINKQGVEANKNYIDSIKKRKRFNNNVIIFASALITVLTIIIIDLI